MREFIKNCPVCNAPMEKGAIMATRRIYWGNPDEIQIFGYPFGNSDFTLAVGINVAKLEGYICRECKTILTQY